MSLLRILRNVAVLVILTVGSLGLMPRPAAVDWACPYLPCGLDHITSCSVCSFGLGIELRCYDLNRKTWCHKFV